MIKNIIFDFGDIFIDLDKTATIAAFKELGFNGPIEEIAKLNEIYEVGKMDTPTFINSLKKWLPVETTNKQIVDAWNAILKTYPKRRFEFFKTIVDSKKYRLFLLSNTNELHIDYIAANTPFFEEFKDCFEEFYLSHEIGFRKPNAEIYEFVLQDNDLTPEETLFVDDTKENTDSASELGIETWNLIPGTDDVTELFTAKADIL